MFKEFTFYPRRQFLAQCAAVPLIAKLAAAAEPVVSDESSIPDVPLDVRKMPEADLTREVESLLQLVDPKVRYRHVPIDAEKNAWPLFEQAGKAYLQEPEDKEFWESVDVFLDNQPIADNARRRISEWAVQNEECRKLVDKGIARGAIELPRATKSIRLSLTTDDISFFRSLARLKSIASQLRLREQDLFGALEEATSILKFGAMLRQGEGLLVDYLIAQIILGIGAYATYRVAMTPGVSGEQARMAINSLAAAKATNEDLKRTHRVEFCRWFLPWVAELASSMNPTELATRYVLGPDSPNFQRKGRVLQEYQRSIRQTAILLEHHPKPFDKEATVRLGSELYQQLFDDLDKPYVHRDRKLFEPLKKELSAWPMEVAPDTWVVAGVTEILGDDPDPPRKLSNRELKRAGAALREVENLLGKRMIVDSSSVVLTPIVEVHQARLEAERLRIALRLYEKQHGRLPAQLDDLVDAKLLPAVPRDPYDGGRFRYSPERRTIWCVGQDGENQGLIPDQQDPEDPFYEDIEMIWRIEKTE